MSEDSYLLAYQRERKARQLAEQLLEEKSRDLYDKVLELESTVEQLKTAQSQLLHAEKMASLGQLVAGLAHELNTPLGFCISNLDTMQLYTKKLLQLDEWVSNTLHSATLDPQYYHQFRQNLQLDFVLIDAPDLLGDTLQGLERISAIVAGLRLFSEEQNTGVQMVNLSELTKQAITLGYSAVPTNVVVESTLPTSLFISGTPAELLQLVMSILSNAVQACGDSGRISIRAWLEQQHVKLAIHNDGPCIAPAHLAKIFDPFFTTKDIGKGAGLGLSIVAGIVKRHLGQITVTSTQETGTEFICSFPALTTTYKS
jgi:C4-dicarboxylate-specific signal transduction histidine kinase